MHKLTTCLLACLVLVPLLAAPLAAQERAPLRVALTGKFPPFSYYDENGELAGLDVDVSRAVARHLGRELEIVRTDWDGILAGLLAGKYDAIIGSMAVTPERAKKVNFSIPYYRSGAQLFVHRDNPHRIYSIEEADGLKIAAVLGETYQHFLEENYPGIEVTTFKSTSEIFEMLESKRIAGFVTDRLVGAWQIRKAGRPFVPVGEMLYAEEIAIPVRTEDTDLLAGINAALREMQAGGTMKELRSRYFGQGGTGPAAEGAMSTETIVSKLARGFAVTLGIAAASLAAGFALSIPVGLLLQKSGGVWALPHWVARTAVDFLRGTPVLIQLLFAWMGLGLSPVVAAVATLGVNATAYMAEVVRAGLMSVDPGQVLAARALGLSRLQAFRRVVWPQAFRIAIPPLMNSVVALTKDTALVAVISVAEVVSEAQSIISVTFEPRKYYFIVAVMFFAVTFPLMKLASRLESRIKQRGFAHD